MEDKGKDLNNPTEGENSAEEEAAEQKDEAIAEEAANPPAVTEVVTETTVSEGVVTGEIKPPPKKKKGARIFWNIFLVVVIALGILSMFGIVKEIDPDSGMSFGEVLRGASPLFCCILVLVVLLEMALDCTKFSIISRTVTGRFRISSSIKANFIGRYYDAVTPFSTGGQPMQIYYLTTKGISGGNATAMVLIKYFTSILSWILLGSALMIWGSVAGILDGLSYGTVLKVTGWVGIGVNLIVPVFVFFFLLFPKLMLKLTVGVVKLGNKMRIVKDVDKTTARAVKVVEDFKSSFAHMAKSPFKLILLIIVSFTEAAINFSIPYFVMRAFACPVDGQFFTVLALNAFATFGVSFVPTPGNSGVVEGMGALAFSVAAGAATVWAVLIWRFAVYYVFILVGIGITIRDIIKKNLRLNKLEKSAQSDKPPRNKE